MAKKKITKADIAPKGIFGNITDGAKEAKVQIDLLTQSVKILKTNAKNIKQSMSTQKVGNTKGQKDFNEAQKRANQTAQAKLKIDKQLLIQKEKLALAQRKQNAQIKQQVGLQKAEIGSLNQLREKNKKLAIEKGKVNRLTKEGANRIKQINAELNKNNLILQKNASAMGKQKMNIGNYGSAIGKLGSMLGRLGGAFLVFRLIKGAFSVVKDFEQSQANLASVLGVNVDEMAALTEQAKLLGATTTFTASQVAELQLEFAKLGFTQQNIEGMTKATLELAEATGTELGEAASVVGATMRGFGLDVTQTQRVTDVMAKSFSSSSLDMTKFSTAMAAVAPVANLAGVSLEKTTALIGTLTDRGLDASTAGTGLRNMFLRSNKAGLTFDQALNQIKNSTDQTAASMKLFGTRGATLGAILANTQEDVDSLTLKLLDSEGAAQKMADTQRDTLGGSIKLLQSAWEGLILKFEEGTGTFGFLKDAIAFLADNLEDIVKGFVILGTALGVYALITKTTKAFQALNLVMKANPYILVASLLAGIIVALKLYTDEMSIAEQITQNYASIQEEATKATAKEKAELGLLLNIAKDKNLSDEDRIEAIERLNQLSPEFLGNLTLENIATEDGVKAINNYIAALDKKALAQAIAAKKEKLFEQMLTIEGSTISDNISFIEEAGAMLSNLPWDRKGQIGDIIDIGEANRTKSLKGIKGQIDALDKLTTAKILAGEINVEDLSGGTPKTPTTTPRVEKEISLLRAREDAEIKLIENAEERDIKARNKRFDRLKEDTEAKKTNKEDFDKWLTAQEELLQADLDAIDAKHEKIRTDKEKKDRDIEIKGKTEAYQKAENEKLLVLLDSTKTQEEVEEALLAFQIEQLEKKIAVWKKLYPELGEQINQMEIDLAKKKRKRDKEEEGTVDDVIDLEKLREDAIVLMTDVFIKKSDERIAKLNEEIAAHKKQADFLKQLAISGNIQAKESLAEENRLIAESEAKKAEEEKRKQRILMVSAVLKAYIANIDAGDGSGEALAKAIASKAVLDQFVAGIGSFFEGTEDTGTVSNGLDSNGGRMAILHNNERVLTAKQNKQIGGYSNDQVANIVEQNRLGKLAGNTKMSSVWDSQLVVDQLLKVESKLDAVNTTIANKEVSSVELGAITQASMNIVERRKKAGNRTISTYKVKG